MKQSKSLRFKLLSITMLMGVIALVSFGVIARKGELALSEGRQGLLRAAANGWIDKIDRNLFERYGDVQAFALSEPARSGNPERITNFMNDMMAAYAPIYDLMMVVDAKGKVIAANNVDKNGKAIKTKPAFEVDFSGEAWFQAAIKDEIKPGTAYVEDLKIDPVVDSVLSNGGRVMTFTAAIRDVKTGKVLGVWTNRMSWTDVVEAITKEEMAKVKSDRIPLVAAYLMDAKGRYLLHPQGTTYELKQSQEDVASDLDRYKKGEILKETKAATNGINVDGLQTITPSKGYSTYPGRGWFASIQIPAADAESKANLVIIFVAAAMLLSCVFFSYLVIRQIVSQFNDATRKLVGEAQTIQETSKKIFESSQSLASSATEQAAALQETAASIEEMNAMVKKNSENASRSKTVSTQSNTAAQKGKQSIDEMEHAIGQINESNLQIMSQIEESNRQIGDIVKVITEIGNKTKVINDIVFQTKLLSFNASVEAARAGEHGKGFAVVAEEVGNLAQMSGNAAKEISDMLTGSIQKVEGIVTETKTRVEKLVQEGKEKVSAGSDTAKKCGQSLDEIVRHVGDLNLMVEEIANATEEQAQGISEITKAMGQLDQTTHQNAAGAQEAAVSSQELSNQSKSLGQVVRQLKVAIEGGAFLSHEENSEPHGVDQSATVIEFKPRTTHKPEDSIPSEQDQRFKEL